MDGAIEAQGLTKRYGQTVAVDVGYVHVIDAASERSVRQFHRQVAEVERLMIASFERPEDWRPAPRAEVAQ